MMDSGRQTRTQQLLKLERQQQQEKQELAEKEALEQLQKEGIFLIRLDIALNGIGLYDQFEWDINNPENSPELFAKSLCTDLV